MVFDLKPVGCQRVHVVQTTRQIENPVALIAGKKVVMVTGGAFVVRCDAGDIDESHAALFDELFDGAVNGGNPERGDFLFRKVADFLRGQRATGIFQDVRKDALLLSRVGHREEVCRWFGVRQGLTVPIKSGASSYRAKILHHPRRGNRA